MNKSQARAGELSSLARAQYAAVVFRDSPDAIIVMDAGGVIRDWNPAAEATFGWTHDAIVGQNAADTIIAVRFREAFRDGLARSRARGKSKIAGDLHGMYGLHRDGHELPIELALWRSDAADRTIFIGVVRDGTERAETAAAEKEQKESSFRVLFDDNPEPMWVYDVKTFNLLDVNGAAAASFHYSRDELLDQQLSVIVPDAVEVETRRRLTKQSPRSRRLVYQARTKEGDLIDVETSSQAVTFQDHAARLVTAHDVSDRRVAQQDYRLLFASHPEPMWLYDPKTLGFVDVNDAAVASYGYSREEFLSMTIMDIRPPDEVPKLVKTLEADEELRSGPWQHIKKDGTRIDVVIASHTTHAGAGGARLVMAQDVTERQSLERHLGQRQRLESIGQLAAGVSHDFNNLLSVIMNYAGFVRSAVPSAPSSDDAALWQSVDDDAQQIERAAERATQLTRQLLAFARKEVVSPEVVDVNDVIRNVQRLLRDNMSANVELVLSLGRDMRRVRVDAGQMERLFINLAVNARDAMPGGGVLTIETSNFDVDGSHRASLPGVEAGRYVSVTLSDTGTGMDAHTAEHAFEPFFTTKETGEGTGLGLATVYGIIAQAGGDVRIDSIPGGGTTFRLLLPEAEALPTAPAP